MKLHLNWLTDAKYSNNYITDNILFVKRCFAYIPEDFGYRKLNKSWEEELDKAFNFLPITKIEKHNRTKSRTYAKTTITKYVVHKSSYHFNQYVILNDAYSYLWNNSTTSLFTLQKSNELQYQGLVGIFENNILKAILSPIIIEDKHLFDDNFWVNVDEKIGLARFIK